MIRSSSTYTLKKLTSEDELATLVFSNERVETACGGTELLAASDLLSQVHVASPKDKHYGLLRRKLHCPEERPNSHDPSQDQRHPLNIRLGYWRATRD